MFIFLCICVYLCMCMRACMWKPKVDVRCHPLSPATSFFETLSLTEANTHQLDRLAGQWFISLLPHTSRSVCLHSHEQLSTWALRIWTHGLTHGRQDTHWAASGAPFLVVMKDQLVSSKSARRFYSLYSGSGATAKCLGLSLPVQEQSDLRCQPLKTAEAVVGNEQALAATEHSHNSIQCFNDKQTWLTHLCFPWKSVYSSDLFPKAQRGNGERSTQEPVPERSVLIP